MTRLTTAMWLGLTAATFGLESCAQKPLPSNPDGRACFVTVLDSETAMMLRAQAQTMNVRGGDWIVTADCLKQLGTDLANETYRMTR